MSPNCATIVKLRQNESIIQYITSILVNIPTQPLHYSNSLRNVGSSFIDVRVPSEILIKPYTKMFKFGHILQYIIFNFNSQIITFFIFLDVPKVITLVFEALRVNLLLYIHSETICNSSFKTQLQHLYTQGHHYRSPQIRIASVLTLELQAAWSSLLW